MTATLENRPGTGLEGTSHVGDRVFKILATAAAAGIMLALGSVFVFLGIEGIPGISVDDQYYDEKGSFLGLVGPLIFGTTYAAVLALVLSVPFAIAIALFTTHYAPRWLSGPISYVMDLLAAVPSVVYGLWGGFTLGRFLQPVHVWLHDRLSFLPFFEGPPSASGRTLFTASIVLAIMVLPIITALCREVFLQTPTLHEEAALALGATRWEMIRLAVFPYGRSGMVSAVMLGLGRALGETMAVAMVLSSNPIITLNIISSGNPRTIAAHIAQNYKESTPASVSVLIAAGLVLFVFTFAVNALARGLVARRERSFR